MSTLFFTVHAQRTMAERGVTRAEIEEAVAEPEVTYRGNSSRPDCKVFQRGELGVVVLPEGDGDYLVITVLWRKRNDWTSDEMRSER